MTLTPDLGNPDLYIKRCSTAEKDPKCTFDVSDILYVERTKDESDQKDQRWIKYSNNTEGLDAIRFTHSLLDNPCMYVVAIVGKSAGNRYTLLLGVDDK